MKCIYFIMKCNIQRSCVTSSGSFFYVTGSQNGAASPRRRRIRLVREVDLGDDDSIIRWTLSHATYATYAMLNGAHDDQSVGQCVTFNGRAVDHRSIGAA